ncbi:MAG: hypothetical protein MRJ92_06740 [Nitrospira sp.]|nr:hypothetical protein [Nitrospira sp.]
MLPLWEEVLDQRHPIRRQAVVVPEIVVKDVHERNEPDQERSKGHRRIGQCRDTRRNSARQAEERR